MNREIVFADGTKFPVGMCGASDGVLWILLDTDMTMLEIVDFLSHVTNTETIKSYSVGYEDDAVVFENYTELVMVQRMTNGFNVALKKEDA